MDSDEVNSINDTTESTQVTYVIETVYNDVISRANFPRHYTLFQLDPSGDPSLPVVMHRPSIINSVDWVKYDTKTAAATDQNIVDVTWMEPQDFLQTAQSLKVSDGNVLRYTLSYNGNSIPMFCTNDQGPRFYTSFDDRALVFDGYDSAVDVTLQSSKTTCWGEKDVRLVFEDTWTADLDDDQFSLLLNEAKSLAFAELKQSAHAKAEKTAQMQWIHQMRNKNAITNNLPAIARLPNYGRKPSIVRSHGQRYR